MSKIGKKNITIPKESSIKIEGANLVKKHNKPSANNPKGGIIEKEAPINISNISLITKDGQTTRFGFRLEKDGKKVRFSKKTNEII